MDLNNRKMTNHPPSPVILIDDASAQTDYFTSRKKGTIQYGYRTWGTHARVFSQTLAHGNSKK